MAGTSTSTGPARGIKETHKSYDCPTCGYGRSNYNGPVGCAVYQFVCKRCGQVFNVHHRVW